MLGFYVPRGARPVVSLDYGTGPFDPVYVGNGSEWSEGDVVTFDLLYGNRIYSLYASVNF